MIHTKYSNPFWPELSPWSFTHVFKKIETTMRWNCMSKSASFSTDNVQTSRFSFFYRISNDKNFIYPKISPQRSYRFRFNFTNTEATIGGKYFRERFWKNSSQWEMLQYNSSIIGNGIIWLLWQLRYYCNPDHNKFSSLSNTTVVAIFPNVCLWCRSLCSKKTSQALTVKNCIEPLSYASTAYVVTSYGPPFCSTVL